MGNDGVGAPLDARSRRQPARSRGDRVGTRRRSVRAIQDCRWATCMVVNDEVGCTFWREGDTTCYTLPEVERLGVGEEGVQIRQKCDVK